ncbi:MAG: restriction endonuclease subunit S, partial [Bacteroidetes bacterium]|nr:restriction endonuclease subunit S [Bacteroidota bacterium]
YGLIVKEDLIINDFLYYILRQKIKQLKNHSHGSVFNTIIRSTFNEILVDLPPLLEQHRIAEILGALDDKIELNLEINKTLEEMAMAIYKEWFVDFGPFRDGEFVDSELGPIPKGWEVVKIDEAIDTFGGGTPKTSIKEYWENGEIIWYSPTDLTKTNSLFSLGSEKKITNLGLQKSSAKLFPPYSILMSSRATIGAITINRYEACTNQGFITLVPNKQFTVYQLFGWLHQNMDTIKNLANGSTFREISKGVFREFKILKARDIDNYFKISKPIFDQIENNLIENNTLTETRDYLLPKLISGEVRVKAAEEKMKEVL